MIHALRFPRAYLTLAILTLAAICLSFMAAMAAPPKTIANPEAFASENAGAFARLEFDGGARQIGDLIGDDSAATTISRPLMIWQNARASAPDKVLDQMFGGTLRQIVYIIAFDDTDFVYFRYNFKRSTNGWVLTNFNFRSETQELFPADFVFGQ